MRRKAHRTKLLIWLLIGMACETFSLGAQTPNDAARTTSQPETRAAIPNAYFEENRGQTNVAINFLAKQGASRVAIARDSIAWSATPIGIPDATQIRLVWKAPAANVGTLQGILPTGGRTNYVLGNDPSQWVLGARHFREVRAPNQYAGIDVVYKALQDQVRYDIEAKPFSDPGAVRFTLSGGAANVASDGTLHVRAGDFSIAQHAPLAYQEVDGARRVVPARFHQYADQTFGFDLGTYDHARELVIDPTIVFSSYIGGSNNDDAQSIGVTKNEALGDLVPGLARDTVTMLVGTSSSNMPVVRSSSHYTASDEQMFVVKLDGDGQSIIYGTYIGGSFLDVASDLAVDPLGNAYVIGYSESSDFPTLNAYQSTNYGLIGGAWNAVVFKLDPRGVLQYSTYFGGSGYTYGNGIAVDAAGNAAITGYTDSPGGTTVGTSFPLVNAAQTVNNGGLDGWDSFVARFNTSGQPIFSTFLGGDDDDEGGRVAYDLNSNVYTVGLTYSETKFATGNALQSTCGTSAHPCNVSGLYDSYLAIHSATGQLKYASYLGGDDDDVANAVAVYQNHSTDNAEVSVGGFTKSANFPTANAYQSARSGAGDAFLSTFVVTPTYGLSMAASTYLGGSGSIDTILRLSTDRWGNIYAAGLTESTNFPLVNPLQSSQSATDKGFVAIFQSPVAGTNGQPGSTLRFSTLIGGSADTDINGIVADDIVDTVADNETLGLTAAGGMYLGIGTTATNFPLQRPVQQGTYSGGAAHGGFDAVVAKIGLCNHMTSLTPPVGMMIAGPVLVSSSSDSPESESTGASDQRLYRIDAKSTQATHVSPSTAGVKFINDFETERRAADLAKGVPHYATTAEWNSTTGTVARLEFGAPYPFDALPKESTGDRALRFVRSHPELFHLSDAALGYFSAKPAEHIGANDVVRIDQQFPDIPSFRRLGITVSFASTGVSGVTAGYYPNDAAPSAVPQLGVNQAYAALRKNLPNLWKTADGRVSPHDGATGTVIFEPDTREHPEDGLRKTPLARTLIRNVGMDFTNELTAHLVYFPLPGGDLRLGWQFTMKGSRDSFVIRVAGARNIDGLDVVIDATDGSVLYAHVATPQEKLQRFSHADAPDADSVVQRQSGASQGATPSRSTAATAPFTPNEILTSPEGTVFMPTPDDGQATVSFAGDPTASPDGWLDRMGTTFYTLGGNNACADLRPYPQELPPAGEVPTNDLYANWRAYSPSSSTGEFTYTWSNAYRTSGGTDTTTDIGITMANAFYWANLAHDHFFGLGFDDTHRNFQRRNFARDPTTGITLGQGDDDVQIFVHYSSDIFLANDSAFSVELEGVRPFMELFLGTPTAQGFPTSLYNDLAVDGQVIVHEYTHGLTSRMIGDATTLGLFDGQVQTLALNEAYSDFFAASLTDKPVIGAYLNGNTTSGIRSYALNADPMTLTDFCNCDKYVNALIWSSALWDMRNLFRETYGNEAGTFAAEKAVVDSFKLISSDGTVVAFSPTIVQARTDLLATQAVGSTARRLIDFAMACRGIGAGAMTSSTADIMPHADFTLADGSLCNGLSVFAVGTPNPVPVQSDLTYGVTVTNGSPITGATGPQSTSTQLTITLPSSVSFVSSSTPVGTCTAPVSDVITCSLGTLAYGSNVPVSVVVVPGSPGSITLSAAVTGNIGGPNPGQPNSTAVNQVCIPDLVFRNGFESSTPAVTCQ